MRLEGPLSCGGPSVLYLDECGLAFLRLHIRRQLVKNPYFTQNPLTGRNVPFRAEMSKRAIACSRQSCLGSEGFWYDLGA
jgi:hypothetical protein